MPRYSEQFKRDAVALYENNEDLSLHAASGPSSFYKWVNTRAKRRLKTCSDAFIGARIKTIFDDEHGLYGAKRIAASLNDDTGFPPINHKKVARIMKSMGLQRL